MAFRDLLGRQFGRLTVIRMFERAGRRGRTTKWLCACSCGREKVLGSNNLLHSHTKSCGCLRNRKGPDSPATKKQPILDRLAQQSYTDLQTGCVVWTGRRLHFNHGMIGYKGGTILVHRAAWEATRGPIPLGLNCLHQCDNPPCWNVNHLFLGTQADNVADRDAKGRHVPSLGQKHGMAKLKEEQIPAIRADPRTARKIAEDYGISESNVSFIKKRQTWRHVP